MMESRRSLGRQGIRLMSTFPATMMVSVLERKLESSMMILLLVAMASYSRISTPKPSYYIKPLAVSGPTPSAQSQPPQAQLSYMRSPSPFSKSSVCPSELGFPASSAASIKSDDDNSKFH